MYKVKDILVSFVIKVCVRLLVYEPNVCSLDHVNQTIGFDSCLWEGCFHKFPRGKQLDVSY